MTIAMADPQAESASAGGRRVLVSSQTGDAARRCQKFKAGAVTHQLLFATARLFRQCNPLSISRRWGTGPLPAHFVKG